MSDPSQTTDATDFAKLFSIEGVGQVLATLDEDDEDCPCVRFRIPDHRGMILTCALSVRTEDYDRAEAMARSMFDALDEDNVRKSVQPLINVRDKLIVEGGVE